MVETQRAVRVYIPQINGLAKKLSKGGIDVVELKDEEFFIMFPKLDKKSKEDERPSVNVGGEEKPYTFNGEVCVNVDRSFRVEKTGEIIPMSNIKDGKVDLSEGEIIPALEVQRGSVVLPDGDHSMVRVLYDPARKDEVFDYFGRKFLGNGHR